MFCLKSYSFPEYYEVVDASLTASDNECATSVKLGTAQIEILMRHTSGQRNLNQKFKLCDPIEKNINNTDDVANLFETMAGNFAGVVQYNKDNRLGKGRSNITIDSICEIMTNESMGPPIDRLAVINEMILEVGNQTCLDYKYDKMISEYRNSSWNSTIAEGGNGSVI